MAKCRHYDVCGIDDSSIPDEGFCILHDPDLDKDRNSFLEALERHRETQGDNFRYVHFPPGAALFEGATFGDDTDFFGTEFGDWADFNGAEFGKGASFFGARFGDRASFKEARFGDRASFKEARFGKGASFNRARFGDRANFNGARFGDWADFFGTEFGDRAEFNGARFGDRAGFMVARFGKRVSFNGARFGDRAGFMVARFGKGVSFSEATFGDQVRFSRLTLEGKVDFFGAVFKRAALFEGTSDAPLFRDAEQKAVEVDLRRLHMYQPEAVVFRNVDFRKCRLLDTDVRKLELTAVTWPKRNRATIAYDELSYDATFYDIPPPPNRLKPRGRLERLYRELKQNYEDRRDYARAGDFHYREKEARRHNFQSTPWGQRALLHMYWAVSGYGERILRPAVWLAILTCACAALYLTLGITPAETQAADDPASLAWTWADWKDTLLFSVRTAFLLRPDTYELVRSARWLHTLQTIASPILVGLLALAIRQRLKR